MSRQYKPETRKKRKITKDPHASRLGDSLGVVWPPKGKQEQGKLDALLIRLC